MDGGMVTTTIAQWVPPTSTFCWITCGEIGPILIKADGTGEVLEVRPGEQWRVLRISIPAPLAPLVVDKGSIAVDGVSLTVSAVSAAVATTHWFEVSLIPETLEATTLGVRHAGDRVNLETDILARHVQRLLSFSAPASAPASAPGALASGDTTLQIPAASAATTDPAARAAATEGGSR